MLLLNSKCILKRFVGTYSSGKLTAPSAQMTGPEDDSFFLKRLGFAFRCLEKVKQHSPKWWFKGYHATICKKTKEPNPRWFLFR